MNYLNWISDTKLVDGVTQMCVAINSGKRRAEEEMGRNVIDPFTTIFSAVAFGGGAVEWRKRECGRQAEKTLTNALGMFHQTILASVDGWCDPGNSETFDLMNVEKKMIAEIKNKHNTVKASDEVNLYDKMFNAVAMKNSKYLEFTSFYVTVVPKRIGIYDFAPSDSKTRTTRSIHPLIKQVDGKTFYEIVTGSRTALHDLLNVLPRVISDISEVEIDITIKELAATLYQAAFNK
jgi:hypothetical protein